MLFCKSFESLLLLIAVSFFLFFTPFTPSYSQETSIFVLKGHSKLTSGQRLGDVEMELKMGDVTIATVSSAKNGKYYIQMAISTSDPENEYQLHITKEGTVPKLLHINTYIPPDEFEANSFARYDFDLEIAMIETGIKDIILERPSGKIHWDSEQHGFAFDQVYAKIIQKEEEKLQNDPDQFLKELAEKKKAEEAKLKAQEEAKQLEEQKAKEEAEKALKQNAEVTVKQEIKEKQIKKSTDSIASIINKTTTLDVADPVLPKNVDPNAFDGARAYSINIAKKELKVSQEKMNKKKSANLSAKYETRNALTSLLDMVDEHDKKQKAAQKSSLGKTGSKQ